MGQARRGLPAMLVSDVALLRSFCAGIVFSVIKNIACSGELKVDTINYWPHSREHLYMQITSEETYWPHIN